MKRRFLVSGALILFLAGSVFAQQTAPKSSESHKYRTILTVAGAGGGFALGIFAGLAAFDDAINSDRKVWATSIVGTAGGATGGYFAGRALDKRFKKTALLTRRPNSNAPVIWVSPILTKDTKGVGFVMSFGS